MERREAGRSQRLPVSVEFFEGGGRMERLEMFALPHPHASWSMASGGSFQCCMLFIWMHRGSVVGYEVSSCICGSVNGREAE